MKKRSISFICLIISFILVMSMFGCGDSGESSNNDSNNNNNNESVKSVDVFEYTGTHDFNITESDNYLVKDGKCDYIVVLPSGAKQFVLEAKNDLLILFKQATGASLKCIYDSSLTDLSTQGHYISLGNTKLVKSAGISESEFSQDKLKSEGIRIITNNNTIFLLGGSDFGVNNAVYRFLEIYFNYDFYYRNCVELDKNVTNCKFKNLDVTDIPDIDHFYGADYVYSYNRSLNPLDAEGLGTDTASEEITYINHRSGYHASVNDLLLPIYSNTETKTNSATIHNVLEYIPVSMGKTEFYSQGGGQLCYTAHGDESLVDEMVQICADKIIFSLKEFPVDKYPYKNYVTFTIEDNSDICLCDACKKEYEELGYSGSLIKFANKIGKKVQEWLNSQKDENSEFHSAYRENFKILIYGYNIYTDPPVDDNGNPISDEVICYDNIGVWHVTSAGISGHADIYDDKWLDEGGLEQIRGWQTITQKSKCLWLWHNSGNIVNNVFFSDGFTTYSQNFYKAMASAGYEYVYAAHFVSGTSELTTWQNLLCYVQSKMRWDCSRNMDYYIRKYMKAMYKDASEVMYDLLQDERVYFASLLQDAKENNNWGRGMKSTEKYPYLVLKGWLNKCDAGIEKISYLKDVDETLYTVVKQRIEIEAAAHLEQIIQLYGSDEFKPFSDAEYKMYKQRIEDILTLSPHLEGIIGG